MLILGDLRYEIKIKALTVVRDEYGSDSETYTTSMTIRAGVKYGSGSKVVDNKELFSSQSIVFTTHPRAITETDRIEFNGKDYRILNIAPIGYNEGLTITAELIND